jgi:hypothetical protein
MANLGKKILVIPDAHARPGESLARFHALGNFIAVKQPDIVVSIGDWADMQSLSTFDKGKAQAEGQRYVLDVTAGRAALDAVMSKLPRRGRKPAFHITLGNHEHRIARYADSAPELQGTVSVRDLGFEGYNWNVHPFLQPVELEGIVFQHYLPSGPMGRAVSGAGHARTLVLKGLQSTVVGHSHQRQYWETTRADGRRVFGLVVGSYVDGRHDYALGTQKDWWNGLTILHEVKQGSAEPAFYSADYIRRKYS